MNANFLSFIDINIYIFQATLCFALLAAIALADPDPKPGVIHGGVSSLRRHSGLGLYNRGVSHGVYSRSYGHYDDDDYYSPSYGYGYGYSLPSYGYGLNQGIHNGLGLGHHNRFGFGLGHHNRFGFNPLFNGHVGRLGHFGQFGNRFGGFNNHIGGFNRFY